MTRPRSELVAVDAEGAYHCVQRCVRRAFLCGNDPYTGRSFEHRKDWVEARIRLVAESFAVAIDAYAVMSNHLHLVLRIDPCMASRWADDDVAARWVRLFPPREASQSAVDAKRQGNPPSGQQGSKVEFSRNLIRGGFHEEVQIHRQPDPGGSQAG